MTKRRRCSLRVPAEFRAAILVSRSDWQVMGLARTIPSADSGDDNGMFFLAADMLEPSSLEQVSDHFNDLTHLVYAGSIQNRVLQPLLVRLEQL